MIESQTVTATEFKAKCLDILTRLAAHELGRVVITKRGRVVGVLTPPEGDAVAIRQLHGFMRGSVVIPPDFDLTEPVLDEEFLAAQHELHG